MFIKDPGADCAYKSKMWSLCSDGASKSSAFDSVLTELCNLFGKGETRRDVLCETVSSHVTSLYSEVNFESDWTRDVTEEKDIATFVRFIDVILERLDRGGRVVLSNFECTMPFKNDVAKTTVNLVIRIGDNVEGIIVTKKNYSGISGGAKIDARKLCNNFKCLAVKYALEHEYAGKDVGVFVTRMFLVNTKESTSIGEWIGDTKRHPSHANELHWEVPGDCGNGVVQFDPASAVAFGEKIAGYTVDGEMDCRRCIYKSICKTPALETVQKPETEETAYRLPNLTGNQLLAVNTHEGQIVCACAPGSGKTAVLTGRALSMKDAGIDPSSILCLSFTNAAANEMKRRYMTLAGVSDGDPVPFYSTLNAWGMNVLLEEKDLLGYYPVVLSESEAMQCALEVLSPPYEMIEGLNYEHLYGDYGVIKRFLDLKEAYDHVGEGIFCLHYKDDLDTDALISRFREYNRIVRERGYITYDMQISECIRLFREHPDILRKYRARHKYVMVDEYQDVDENMDTLVRLLAGDNGNVCIVGDDDQSIYGFRGGSCEFMRDFTEHYPNAKVIVFGDNFRSGDKIVELASKYIQRDDERIPKDMIAHFECPMPEWRNLSEDMGELETLVGEYVSKGYSLSDIAILARDNATLQKIKEKADFSSYLNRSILINDPVFSLVFGVLDFYFTKSSAAFLRLMRCFSDMEIVNEIKRNRDMTLSESFAADLQAPDLSDWNYWKDVTPESFEESILKVAAEYLYSLKNNSSTNEVLDIIAYRHGLMEDRVIGYFRDMIETNRNLENPETFYKALNTLVRFSDETRIDRADTDAVALATSHDAKGMEWPVVIVYGVEKYGVHKKNRNWWQEDKDDTAERRRLLYVSVTRAKKELCIVQTGPADSVADELINDLFELKGERRGV